MSTTANGGIPLMASNMSIEYHPGVLSIPHFRSASVCSSTSAHSTDSRPQSSQGIILSASTVVPTIPLSEDLYRPAYMLGRATMSSHTRHSSNTSQSTTYSTDLISPADSPPNHNHTNPSLKPHLRPTHIRARNATSPYPRDAESVYSSSSEAEDISMFFGHSPPDYHSMFVSNISTAQGQETARTTGQFGRMSLGHDHALEHLANNVRSATTTSASDRAKQIFVQAWLSANYAPYPDGNVPRQGLYFSYRRVCDQYGIPHINTATLGKAIRLCFPTIKTRRLGVRGNSKYHYCGIRPITATEIDWLQDYVRKSNNNSSQTNGQRPQSASGQNVIKPEDHSDDDEDEDGSEGAGSHVASKRTSLIINGRKSPTLFSMDTEKTPTTNSLLSQAQASRPNYQTQPGIRRQNNPQDSSMVNQHQHPSTDTSLAGVSNISNMVIPAPQAIFVRSLHSFPKIEEALGSDPASSHGTAARQVWCWFEDHLDALLESVRTFRFDQFELNVRTFWTSLSGDHREVVHAPAVAGLMAKADTIVYDEILEILRSQLLSNLSPVTLTSLRQLADKMEKILLMALENYGSTFVEPKVELGARFGHLVLRFLDIFQVTQALTTVLTNQKQLADMRRSWQSIDFESVRNQSALVCNCRHEDLVQLLEVDFVALLNMISKSQEPVQDVIAWADNCCERLLGVNRGSAMHEERTTMSSRSILIRWGYVTSQIMRDLTIRSDPAFGAFQILKLFLDDWIALNVLRSVALSTNSVAASVEPVIQQQFFTLSPMIGNEQFMHGLDSRGSHSLMTHTPTTSSMLAALQDSFVNGTLESNVNSFSSESFNSMAYMESAAAQDEPLENVHGIFDYNSGVSFDVNPFPSATDMHAHQDAILASSTVHTPPDQKAEVLKEDKL